VCAPVDFANASTLAQARHLFGEDGRRLERGWAASDVTLAFQHPAAVDLASYTVAHPAVGQWMASGPANAGSIELVYTAQGSPWTESRCTVENVTALDAADDADANDDATTNYRVFVKQPCFQALQQKPCGQGTSTPAHIENALADDLQPGQWLLHRPGGGAGVGQLCAADFGHHDACCGQPGTVPNGSAYICPATAPLCTGYVLDSHWGACAVAATPNGTTTTSARNSDDDQDDDAPCSSDDQCRLPCPAGEVGRCVLRTCQCVSQAQLTTLAVYVPLPGEVVSATTTMHMPVLEQLVAATGSDDVTFVGACVWPSASVYVWMCVDVCCMLVCVTRVSLGVAWDTIRGDGWSPEVDEREPAPSLVQCSAVVPGWLVAGRALLLLLLLLLTLSSTAHPRPCI
jgi:hypothetical protein